MTRVIQRRHYITQLQILKSQCPSRATKQKKPQYSYQKKKATMELTFKDLEICIYQP
jgi:hypothetical protein